jgi:hypothetical protein
VAGKVTAIMLQNFMGYVDTDWIVFRPITLLFGRNSSGKSALIRAILLLRQSLQPEPKPLPTERQEELKAIERQREPLNFIADGGVDLGSFWQMIHAHTPFVDLPDQKNALRQMVFGFRCQIALDALKEIKQGLPATQETFVDLHLNYQLSKQNKSELSAVTLALSQVKDGKSLNLGVILQAELLDVNDRRGWYLSNHFQKHDDLYYTTDTKFLEDNPDDTRILWRPKIRIFTSSGFLPTVFVEGKTKITESIAAIFNQCCEAIRDWLSDKTLWHLEPIRSAPRRTYRPAELSRHKWDGSGESAVFDFIDSYDEQGETHKRINESFEHLTIGKKVQVLPLKPQTLPYSEATPSDFQIIVLKDDASRGVNLCDGGYGASQVLPVILKIWLSAGNTFGIVEEPELHLHPEAQANLADLFIASVNETRGDDDLPQRCFLLETHSETLFLRLRVELAKTAAGKADRRFTFRPEDFACYYVDRDQANGISTIEQMLFDMKGEYEHRPRGFVEFFGQDFKESMELKKAGMGGKGRK